MRAAMALASLVLVAAVAVTAQVPAASRPVAAAALVRLPIELPDNPAAGARLFAEEHCVRCHALGTGESKVGPDLGRIRLGVADLLRLDRVVGRCSGAGAQRYAVCRRRQVAG